MNYEEKERIVTASLFVCLFVDRVDSVYALPSQICNLNHLPTLTRPWDTKVLMPMVRRTGKNNWKV